jgi:putative component of toxin-antitoxin plasmid stabilization module
MARTLVTVAETAGYLKDAERLMSQADRDRIVDSLAADPERGDVIPGGGGIRKLRIALEGRGKRGGARVIYYYHSDRMPIYALAVFAKNERSDLSHAQRTALATVAKRIAREYGG